MLTWHGAGGDGGLMCLDLAWGWHTSTTWAASISLGTDSEGLGLEASVLGVEVERLSVAELLLTPAASPAMEPDMIVVAVGF